MDKVKLIACDPQCYGKTCFVAVMFFKNIRINATLFFVTEIWHYEVLNCIYKWTILRCLGLNMQG